MTEKELIEKRVSVNDFNNFYISPEKITEFIDKFKLDKACEFCNGDIWHLGHWQTGVVHGQVVLNQDGQEGMEIDSIVPAFNLYCSLCGNIRSFLKFRLIAWIKAQSIETAP